MHINNKSLMRLYAVFGVSIVVGYFAAPALKDQNEDRSKDSYAQNVTDNKDELDSVTEDINLDSILHNNPDSISKEPDDKEKSVDNVIETSDKREKYTEEISNPSDEEKKTGDNSESQIREGQDQYEAELERINEENRLNEEQKKRDEEMKAQQLKEENDRKNNELKNQISRIVVSGSSSKKIPDTFKIHVNGRAMDYQNFRQGVRSHAYTNIRVNSIDIDNNGMVRSVNVSAVSSQNYDEQ